MITESFKEAVAGLLHAAGYDAHFSLQPITGGANNRLFRVELDGGKLLLKAYFRHPGDTRDRLRAEFSFLTFAWDNGIRRVPQPLASDPQNNLGLYEYIAGRRLSPQEVTLPAVNQAVDFYLEINRHKHLPAAQGLPQASEACFTIADHLRCIERRLHNLGSLDAASPIEREAADFVKNDMCRVWESIAASVGSQADKAGLPMDTPIDREDMCLSPSDFGFHNALLGENNLLRFIDFEYAGWDDPAKLICDFFCQPAVPVPPDYYNVFAGRAVSDLSQPQAFLRRARLLLPVYRLKWCCIMLNDFLPVAGERRRFVNESWDREEHRAGQLHKARLALGELAKTYGEYASDGIH